MIVIALIQQETMIDTVTVYSAIRSKGKDYHYKKQQLNCNSFWYENNNIQFVDLKLNVIFSMCRPRNILSWYLHTQF